MPTDFLQKLMASSFHEHYKIPEGVLDEREIYVTRLDEHSPIQFQIIKDVMSDSMDTKTLSSHATPWRSRG